MRVFSRIFLRFPSTPHLAKPMLYAVLFMRCVFFTRCVCKYAGEVREIYSFLALAKRGKGNALFVFSWVKHLAKNKMCISLCCGLFTLFIHSQQKNVCFRSKNVIYKGKNISFKRSNIIYKHENIIYKNKNITFGRANIIYNRKNIKKS